MMEMSGRRGWDDGDEWEEKGEKEQDPQTNHPPVRRVEHCPPDSNPTISLQLSSPKVAKLVRITR
jgi:hypothetical protein